MSKIEIYLYRILALVLLALVFQICDNTRLMHEDMGWVKMLQEIRNKK